MDLKATTGRYETLESNFLPNAASIQTFHTSIQLKKHDAEEAHLYVRDKPPTALTFIEPLPISLYSLY